MACNGDTFTDYYYYTKVLANSIGMLGYSIFLRKSNASVSHKAQRSNEHPVFYSNHANLLISAAISQGPHREMIIHSPAILLVGVRITDPRNEISSAYLHYNIKSSIMTSINNSISSYTSSPSRGGKGNSYVASLFQTRQVEPSLIVHLLERIRDVQAAQIQNNTNRIPLHSVQ